MGYCPWILGVAVVAFGTGILIGGLLPSWVIVWLLASLLILAGVCLLKRFL